MISKKDAFERTANRIRQGTKITQKEARKILAESLERSERKNRGK